MDVGDSRQIHSPTLSHYSRENYRALLLAIPDLMVRLDRRGVCLDFVPAKTFRSLNADFDWRGKHLSEFIPVDVANKRLFYVEQAFLTGEEQVYEQQITVDGAIQYEEVRIVISGEDEVLVLVRDVTQRVQADLDRKHAEAALRQNEAQFQRLAANVPGMFYQFRLEPSGHISFPYASPYSKDLFEVEPEVLTQDAYPIVSRIHPDDLPGFEASVQTSAQALLPYEWIGRYIAPSGKLKWIEAHSRPISQPDGAIVWNGVLLDVTDRRLTEIALQQTEAQYHSIFKAVSDAILIRDLQTEQLLDVNPAACEMFGYSREELLELAPADLVPPNSPTMTERFIHTLKSGKPFIGQAVNVRKDKTQFNVEVQATMFSYQGKPCALKLVRDISDRMQIEADRQAAEAALRRSEAQLRQQAQDLEHALGELRRTQAQLIQNEKMSSLGQVVAGIAHEINNPVTFIYSNIAHATNYLQSLVELINLYQSRCAPDSEIESLLKEIDLEFVVGDFTNLLDSVLSGADRIRQLVLSLRNFARLDEAEFKSVNVHEGLDSTLMILQNRLIHDYRGNKIAIVKDYGDLPQVECYAGQLNQVFFNLISNAIDAIETTERPSITIRTEHANEQWVRIHIIDNGCGIPDAVRDKIFDPFFTTKPIGKGVGIGLSTSYQIVAQQHAGFLRCHSIPNQGTAFVIEIPIRQMPRA